MHSQDITTKAAQAVMKKTKAKLQYQLQPHHLKINKRNATQKSMSAGKHAGMAVMMAIEVVREWDTVSIKFVQEQYAKNSNIAIPYKTKIIPPLDN